MEETLSRAEGSLGVAGDVWCVEECLDVVGTRGWRVDICVLEAWFKRVLDGLALPWGHGKRFQDGMDVVEDCQEELAKDEAWRKRRSFMRW